jgi:GT2 family glycosyltransferase
MSETINFPKVLVCAPQHDSKNYAFDLWWERVKNLTYPNYQVYLADNSSTEENTKAIEALGIKAEWVKPLEEGLYFTMAAAHNKCREYALNNGFDYILHLETDVIPPMDVIERLMKNKKKVCAGMYDIFYGSSRKLMVQLSEPFDRTIRAYRTVEFLEESEPLFMTGGVEKVFHAGLGCVLIRKDVLAAVEFRAEAGVDYHPDTWFANDCFQLKIPIFVDTTVMCEHHNQTWLSKIDQIKDNMDVKKGKNAKV